MNVNRNDFKIIPFYIAEQATKSELLHHKY
jgi:hypothetical protein